MLVKPEKQDAYNEFLASLTEKEDTDAHQQAIEIAEGLEKLIRMRKLRSFTDVETFFGKFRYKHSKDKELVFLILRKYWGHANLLENFSEHQKNKTIEERIKSVTNYGIKKPK